MAFLGFGAPKRISVTLIDIDSSSVGGALAYSLPGTTPTICFSKRTPIELRSDEKIEEALMRTLQIKVRELIEQGGPLLRRETGSGHTDHIYVRIGTPWQKTSIRREKVEEPKPFTYTLALEKGILKKKNDAPAGYQSIEERIAATLLNGYETDKPYGKQVRQVEVVISSSWIDSAIIPEVQKIVRSAYHTHALTFTTPTSMTFSVFRKLFPHEKNYLALEISGESTEMLYVKNGILVKTSSLALGVNDIIRHARDGMHANEDKTAPQYHVNLIDPVGNQKFADSVHSAEESWTKKIESLFQEFASEQALPRTIFLIAPEGTREYLTRLLDTPTLRSLWLSDEPLRVIGVMPSHLAPFVALGAEADQDTILSLFTLYASLAIHTTLLKG